MVRKPIQGTGNLKFGEGSKENDEVGMPTRLASESRHCDIWPSQARIQASDRDMNPLLRRQR
uniref:Uncharacterized protein n=1 Tax=Oryza nivara TaxID=4536 RepID=A0A0E0FH28_ORYNI